VTLAGNVTETLFALGLGDKVIGVDSSSLFPPAAESLPRVGYFRNLNAEGVLSMAPELVITTDAAGPPETIEQIRSSGIPLVVLDSAQSFDGAVERVLRIGKLLNRSEEAKKIAAAMEEKISSIQRPEKPPKVLFIYARGAGTLNVAGSKTSAEAMIDLAGGTNAVTDYEGYKPMSAEAIIAAAPDYILFTSRGLDSVGGVDEVIKLNGLAETPAGKNGKIIALDDLLLLGFGPRTADGAVELSNALQE
jgi:iron complex transport system substrate-binding protein